MQIYNEQTKQFETFKPLKNGEIKMYVCGPTVYSDIHIGNARPIIFFDFVSKVFQKNGYNVVYVSNVTDVDDKIINRANEQGISEQELVQINMEAFSDVLNKLGVSYTHQPRVMETMDQIIDFIDHLVKAEVAYVIDGDVYFDVSKVEDYGIVSNLNIEQNQEASRIEQNTKKRNPNDFTLWKETAQGINWESTWSHGRPGWHTECVVMIRDLLGDKIDIHGGGIDLQFPHHENENAQSMACSGPLANYWMHNGFININNEKMSKSLGNTFLAKDFINEYSSNILRLVMFQTNYRQPINLTDEFIDSTKTIDNKFYDYAQRRTTLDMDFALGETLTIVNKDFDAPNLITYLLQVIKDDSIESQKIFNSGIYLLGLEYQVDEIPALIKELINQREESKKAKDYQRADAIRDEIESQGYILKDTREGTLCMKAKNK